MHLEVPGIVGWIIVGLAAGWLASKIMGSQRGWLANLFLGLVGALVGGLIFSVLGFEGSAGILGSIVVATIGAIIILAIIR